MYTKALASTPMETRSGDKLSTLPKFLIFFLFQKITEMFVTVINTPTYNIFTY